jgi:polysaccharide biosynthesis protein PslG
MVVMQRIYRRNLGGFSIFLSLLVLTCCSEATAQGKCSPIFDNRTIPCGFGVNIDFTDPRPGEMEMLAAAGFRWVRMDLKWDATEVEKGKYDFSDYDRLMSSLESVGVQALFILDYGNPLYDNGAPPRSDSTRAAFTNWAVAAAKHFRNRGVIWELYNEPNHDLFWPPKPNANEYVALALSVGRRFQEQVPTEILIGPAVSEIDLKFLEACFKSGVLRYWSAVSVHPYRRDNPENVSVDYQILRQLVDRYAPVDSNGKKKRIPIISGEWGYSTSWPGISAQRQAELLTRSWLTNLMHDVRLSIWYDWRDDGTDPGSAEHNFGTVGNSYRAGHMQVYEPKHAYIAARAVSKFFNGYSFERKAAVNSQQDYVVLFRKGSENRIAAWTTDSPHKVTLNIEPGWYESFDYLGNELGRIRIGPDGFAFRLTSAPVFLRKHTFVRN